MQPVICQPPLPDTATLSRATILSIMLRPTVLTSLWVQIPLNMFIYLRIGFGSTLRILSKLIGHENTERASGEALQPVGVIYIQFSFSARSLQMVPGNICDLNGI